MSEEQAAYVHGTDPEEQDRLGLMNGLINPGCLRELRIEGGEHVLDVGAGLGHFSRVLAEAVGPRGRVVAIERDPSQLAAARGIAPYIGPFGDLEQDNS